MRKDLAAAPVPAGAKRCTLCRRAKPVAEFYRNRFRGDGLNAWCRTCCRARSAVYRGAAAYRAWRAAYEARPEFRRRPRPWQQTEAYKAARLAYAATPRARVLSARRSARKRLRAATTDRARRKAAAVIAAYDREIARMERSRAC